jgi:predicted amino acid dehydrogenase
MFRTRYIILVLLISILYYYYTTTEMAACKRALPDLKDLKKIDPKSLTVGILGYTGVTGKELADQILKNNIFKSTVLIGRRKVEYEESYLKNAVILFLLLN